ncbi:unnamed protein product [Fraxinus pennsylvanica]|uniref:Uncharacterized protein n=1 Tax=Fraxinus pennsylvanica TaxID=56036 RepID=A0AAD2E140_9LAMI|nr:unnamed protein product [Fraxinus pennsylvanica]
MSKGFLIFMFTLTMLLFFKETIILARSGCLPEKEKDALREIAESLGKKHLNPCHEQERPESPDMPSYNDSIICSSPSADGVCHVESISLKGQDLAGVLPPSLANLTYLKSIDLTRNYLSGTIPKEWEETKLEYMSLMANRLSGPIPKYLGNISTLVYMNLESNRFNGTVPAELGKLVNLKTL